VSYLTKNIKLVLCIFALILPAFEAMAWQADVRESMTAESIKARIKPLGEVEVDGERQVASDIEVILSADSGQKRYDKSCSACHARGLSAAPKFRDTADWADRLPMGLDALLASSIKGKGAMPPKGTCMECSDKELMMAIEYMIPQ
jgi:cytochrome c5